MGTVHSFHYRDSIGYEATTITNTKTIMSSDAGTSLQPGQSIRPVLGCEGAKKLVERLYNLKVLKIKELNSYDDRNFHIIVDYTHSNSYIENINKDGYVFKVLNSMDSQKTHVDAEHESQRLLQKNGVLCSVPVKNIYGTDKLVETISENGNKHVIRLLTFISGVILADVPCTANLIHNVGTLLGQVTQALQDWNHEALLTHKTVWSLSSISDLRKFTYAIEDTEKTALVEDVIQSFEKEVLLNESKFEKAAIHGDFNEQNIIVSEDGGQVKAIIDFGDMQYSCLLYDIAITIMYMMVVSSEEDALVNGGHLLAGYSKHRTIPQHEWQVLKVCVAARFCQSLVMGAYSYSQDPGNEYLLVTASMGWQRLRQIWNTPNKTLIETWKNVIDS